ncbi:MAG: glutathione S-transferase family protein, partial [Mesorhizobium sp.]
TLIGVARWAEFHQAIEGADYPRLAALRERIQADPVVQYALAVEDGRKPVGSGACLGHVPLAEVIERFAA